MVIGEQSQRIAPSRGRAASFPRQGPDQTVGVLLNQGDGTFSPKVDSAPGGYPQFDPFPDVKLYSPGHPPIRGREIMRTLIHARSPLPGLFAAALAASLGSLLAACEPSKGSECDDGAVDVAGCGLNGRGTISRSCASGSWGEPGACVDPDVCKDGVSGSQACGLNGRGTAAIPCTEGAFGPPDSCEDPDSCKDGASRPVTCGTNGNGTQVETCEKGSWVASDCITPGTCHSGEVWTEACGVLGVQSRSCVGSEWGDFGPCDDPLSLTINVPGRVDMVHDGKRHRVYITTGADLAGGEVRVFDLISRSFVAPLLTGSIFMGIDLSPDGNHLLVAEDEFDGNHNWIYEINLEAGTTKKIPFILDFYEGGTFSVAFLSDTEALVTSNFLGSGQVPLRRVDLVTEGVDKLSSVQQDTMLARSADGSKIAFAESNISFGEWGSYDVASKSIAQGVVFSYVFEIGVAKDASQYAIPTSIGLQIEDKALTPTTLLGGFACSGAVYSPVNDELYVAWSTSDASLDVYSATTLEKVRDIDATPSLFEFNSNRAYGDGRLHISRDGAMLLVSKGPSVILYHTGP